MSQKENTYTVLARKYRPQTFSDLIGQDALVQTLTNAIKQDRLAHAYLLTGIRGVGKTSTARIIAKALTCVGKDGKGEATPEPCGVCENCKSIAESRCVDVLEMDAASRTGVNDIREIIENASYLPTQARYKIYIIDEVHMLSKSAFNALLKTLEEPPPHVKFIFATTEVRKIPITILSRCQRFDLPRIDTALLTTHLGEIAKKEEVTIDEETLAVIAKAGEGSVRDALSLLDQAIAHGGSGKEVKFEQVAEMLGLLGKDGLIKLFENIAKGNVAESIKDLREMYHSGADPVLILQDLLELSHILTQIKVIPDLTEASHLSKDDFASAKAIAEKLDTPFLTRCWQMLLKGIQEVNIAANPLMSAEMIIIRLSFASSLPAPGDLIKKLGDVNTAIKAQSQAAASTSSAPATEGAPVQRVNINNFEQLVELFKEKQEPFLYNWLQNEIHLVKFEKCKLEIRMTDAAPQDLPSRLMESLKSWTGERWIVIVSNEEGDKTIKQKANDKLSGEKQKAAQDPEVLKILETFPGAEIENIYKIEEKEESEEDNIEEEAKAGEQK